jgi:hypothetical protein
MTITTPLLSAEEARLVRDTEPSFSNRQGIDLPSKLNDFAAEVAAEVGDIQSGSGTVLNGATTAVIAVGTEFNGAIAVVSFAEAPVAASKIWAGPVAGGNLTVAIDVDNTADVDFHYILDGRS